MAGATNSEPNGKLAAAHRKMIEQLAGLVRQIARHERLQRRHQDSALRHDIEARRARIEAAKIVMELIADDVPKMAIYKAVKLSPKEGRNLPLLASLYADVDAAELDRRQKVGRLLSVNQARALHDCAQQQSNAKERRALIEQVRDREPLGDPTFGPAQIAVLARQRKKDENDLRELLGIPEAEIERLRKAAPQPPKYNAEFLSNGREIVIEANSLPLFAAALTKDEAKATASLNFFASGNRFKITLLENNRNGCH